MNGIVPGAGHRAKSSLTAQEQAIIAAELNHSFDQPTFGTNHRAPVLVTVPVGVCHFGKSDSDDAGQAVPVSVPPQLCGLIKTEMNTSGDDAGHAVPVTLPPMCRFGMDATSDDARHAGPTTFLVASKVCIGAPSDRAREHAQAVNPNSAFNICITHGQDDAAQSAAPFTFPGQCPIVHPGADAAHNAAPFTTRLSGMCADGMDQTQDRDDTAQAAPGQTFKRMYGLCIAKYDSGGTADSAQYIAMPSLHPIYMPNGIPVCATG